MKKTDTPNKDDKNKKAKDTAPEAEFQEQPADVYEPIDMDALREEVQGIIKEKDEYYRLLQQVTADFDNYKKRNASLRLDVESETRRALVADFLPVLDNLERALGHAASGGETEGLQKGVDMVTKQFLQTLEKMGIAEISANEGDAFSPDVHNAVATVPEDETHPDGTIFDVLQKGYKQDDRIIRYAMVRVAQK